MKIWLSAVIWDEELKKGTSQIELLEKVKALSLSGVELRPYWNETDELNEFHQKATEMNLGLTYAGMEPIIGSSLSDSLNHFEKMKESIDIAWQLGSSLLRVNISFEADWSLLRDENWQAQAQAMITYAKSFGIELVVENPPCFAVGRIAEVKALLEALPGLKLTFDTGNWMIVGEHPVHAARQLAPWIGYLHLKDVRFLEDGQYGHLQPGAGGLDFKNLLAEIYASGYQGPAVLEFHGGKDPEKRIQSALEYLKEAGAY